MELKDQVNYAYSLIQLMKMANGRTLQDLFLMQDFKILQINFCDTAVGSISVRSLTEVLKLIEEVRLNLWVELQHPPTYQHMREALRPNSWYR